ncbi:hypothetical protein D3C75_1206360 [compost metagenome]
MPWASSMHTTTAAMIASSKVMMPGAKPAPASIVSTEIVTIAPTMTISPWAKLIRPMMP